MKQNNKVKQELESIRAKARIKHETVKEAQTPIEPSKTITKRIEEEKARQAALKNQAFAQDIKLKKQTLSILVKFLALETTAIFAFALLQATNWLNFQLEEWSFRLLTTATILQITAMLHTAVKHLFPQKAA